MRSLVLAMLLATSSAFAQDAGVPEPPPQPREAATGSRAAEAEAAERTQPAPPPPRSGATDAESRAPATDADAESRAPTTDAESREPTADAESREPTTDAESREPTADAESREPTADAESREPTTDAESREPTTAAESREPSAERRATDPDTPVATRVERHTETRFVPMAGDSEPDPITTEIEELSELFGTDRSLGALALLLMVVLLAALAAVALRRVRERLEPTGLLPTLLALLHLALRLIAVAFALALLIRVLPPRATLVMLLTFGGVAIAIGWSARDVLPDLVAGFLLVFERRIRGGMWLVGDGFSGQVRRVGVRSTLLIDVMGRQLEVPNRHLVRSPLTSDASGEQEHEVLVRFEREAPAEQIRAALRDAVLASPWVLPGSEAVVLRDPDEPWLWRVRGHLLDPTLVARFEGDLLERAEEILAAFEEAGRAPHDVSRPRTSRREGDAL
ncbi:MAG: mechanosensitive ion channel [Deltaproteobacteria bacterium]|nr:mechanosensitive ion channel [Deltaproteobacteria bacterium]